MNKRKYQARERPVQTGNPLVGFLTTDAAYDTLCVQGYTPLRKNPEIITAVNRIATLISSMTIYLMENTDRGDVRVRNELSRKIDINPYSYGTRQTFMQTIVRAMLLDGDGNAFVLPVTRNGLIDNLIPIPPSMTTMREDGFGYVPVIGGKDVNPDDVLHFVSNPDPEHPWRGQGYRIALRDVAHNLRQAAETKRGFMASKWKPSVIVKVDGLVDEFSNKEGRRKLLESYIETDEAGQPWLIPAEQFSIEQVKPLSLNDLAINDSVQIDKRTVASILGVPPFVLGVGEFNSDAWNNFINATIMPIAKGIEQELTKKLLISPNW